MGINEVEAALVKATKECKSHAKRCKDCFVPIMDEEGNPQLMSEACSKGYELLVNYNRLEAEYFKG